MTPFARKFRKALPIITVAIVFILLSLLSYFIIENSNKVYNEHQSLSMITLSERITNLMYNDSMQHLSKAYMARSLLQRNGEALLENPDAFAFQFERLNSPYITAFAYAPSGIITAVYPKQGNEWQLGLNYQLTFPDRVDLRRLAEIDSPLMLGPYPTPSGKQELAAIIPLNDYDTFGTQHFWGTITVCVQFPEVFYEIDFSEINRQGFAMRVWKNDSLTGEERTIYSTEIPIEDGIKSATMNFSKEFFATPWNFTFAPLKSFFESPDFYAISILLVIGVFVVSIFAYVFVKNMQALEEKKLYQIQDKLLQIQEHTIFSLSNLVENRDSDTGNHVRRTSNYVALIAKKAQECGYNKNILTDQYIEILRKAAPMHDIGKIIVPDSVLKKQGKLTPEEFEQIKRHTTEGGRIIQEIIAPVQTREYTHIAVEIATSHHERWDGTGYPHGLSGEHIPISARIMALADVFDALTTARCYKAQMPFKQAMQIMEEGKGTQFDPTLIDIFLQNQSELQVLLSKSTIN